MDKTLNNSRKILDNYKKKKIREADEYYEIKNKDIRLAALKANDLYYVIMETQIELYYVDKGYYKNNDFDVNFARYLHLKNAIQDLNRLFDIALQIPWFLYRIWQNENFFKKDKYARGKFKNIIKLKENISEKWVSEAEELCDFYYVKRYLNENKNPKHEKIVELLSAFKKEFLYCDEKNTVRSVCNYIKHKGNIQPIEIKAKTDLNIDIENHIVNIDELILIPIKCNIPKELEAINWKAPNIILKNTNNNFKIDLIYNSEKEKSFNNFYGKDLTRKIIEIDKMYDECINYLVAFKPIYDLYIDILKDYLYPIFKEPIIKSKSIINLNNIYQKR